MQLALKCHKRANDAKDTEWNVDIAYCMLRLHYMWSSCRLVCEIPVALLHFGSVQHEARNMTGQANAPLHNAGCGNCGYTALALRLITALASAPVDVRQAFAKHAQQVTSRVCANEHIVPLRLQSGATVPLGCKVFLVNSLALSIVVDCMYGHLVRLCEKC